MKKDKESRERKKEGKKWGEKRIHQDEGVGIKTRGNVLEIRHMTRSL